MTVEAKLKITPVMSEALAALKALVGGIEGVATAGKGVDAQAALPKTTTGIKEAGAQADATAAKVAVVGKAVKSADEQGGFAKTRAGLDGVGRQLERARTQLLAFFGLQQGAQATGALAGMSDQYQGMRARLRLVTEGQGEFNAAVRIAQKLSADYNQPLAETSSLYTRLLSAVRPLGGGMREAGVATEAMLASLKISGATVMESQSAILQFSQALGSGVLRGEEFNAINEAAPRLLTALASGLGVSKSALKGMAEQGQLTTSAIVQALGKALPQLQRDAASIPGTIGGAYDQLKGKVAQFVGASAEASGSASNAIAVLKLLADNINTVMVLLQGLAAFFVAGWIIKGAGALVTLGKASVGAAEGVGVLRLAVTGLWTAIKGPLGLIAAVISLKEVWDLFSASKDKAKNRTADQARAERDDVNKEIADIEAAYKRGEFGMNAKARYQLLQRDKKRLDAEIVTKDNTAADSARAAFRKSELDPVVVSNMRDPATIESDRKAFPTAQFINEEYAKKRAKSLAAWKTDIDLENDPAKKLKLQKDLNQVLIDQEKERVEKIRDLKKNETLTRITSAKVLYDKDFELLADATQREKKLVQERFDQGLLDLQTYLANKARLSDDESNQEIARLRAKQVAEKVALEKNQGALAAAKDANGRAQAEEAVAGNKSKLAELDVDITKAERQRTDNARELKTETQNLTNELEKQALILNTELRQARGTESDADIASRVKKQMEPGKKEFVNKLGGDAALYDQVIGINIDQEKFKRIEAQLAQAQAALQNSETSVQIDQAAGLITTEEAEKRILAQRREQLPVLQEIAVQIAASASTLGPEEKAKADQAKNSVKQLGDVRTEAEKTIRSSLGTGFGTFFTELVSGTKTAGDALRNMLGNFANTMLNLISQRLGEQLVDSLLPKGGMASGGGVMSSLWSALGFHSGGVVAGGNASFTRNAPAAAFAFAPRYHTGGIAGMAPRSDEVYAVLQKGEEVLTADDPRHVANGGAQRGGMGGVAISVTVNGAGGDNPAKNAAGTDLARQLEGVIDQWALKQSRPGGILFAGGR